MPLQFKKLEIPEVLLVEPSVHQDARGFLLESFRRSEFLKAGIAADFVQDIHSRSQKNSVRGLHYQLNPAAQAKLVRCIRGAVFDVAVDLRKKSGTFGKWVGAELSEENKKMLYIPEGFAHGFAALSDVAEITYKMTQEYSPAHERGVRWDDASIGICWPITNPVLSERDARLPLLKEAETNF